MNTEIWNGESGMGIPSFDSFLVVYWVLNIISLCFLDCETSDL